MRRSSGHGLPEKKEGWPWRGRIKKENLVKQTWCFSLVLFYNWKMEKGEGNKKEEILVDDIYVCMYVCGVVEWNIYSVLV